MDYDQTDTPAVYEAGRAYSSQVLSLWLSVVSRWGPRMAPPTFSISASEPVDTLERLLIFSTRA